MSEIKWNGAIMPDHHISHAFTCGGTPYFSFTDAFSIPCERAMDALHIYQEFKSKTDDEFLKAHCQAKQALYLKNPISVFELKKLDDQLQERLDMALPPPRMIEQLASVYFFDASENPYRYDRAYAEKKIAKWKTEKIEDKDGFETPYDFFLYQRLVDIIPSWNFSSEDTQTYLRIAQMVDMEHLKAILSTISSEQAKTALFNSVRSTNIGEKMLK